MFTEFSEYRRLGSRKAVVDIGSVAQPFSIFIPDIEVSKGQAKSAYDVEQWCRLRDLNTRPADYET